MARFMASFGLGAAVGTSAIESYLSYSWLFSALYFRSQLRPLIGFRCDGLTLAYSLGPRAVAGAMKCHFSISVRSSIG